MSRISLGEFNNLFMKKKIAAIFCLLLIMGMLPLTVVSLSGKSSENGCSTADSSSDLHKISAYAANMCNSDFCDEALKAALIIARTNYLSGQKDNENYSDKELYNKINNIYNSENELYLSYNGEAKFIPHSFCSNGTTTKSEKYGYITPVASPWDCGCAEFSKDNKCEGVSMYGINYLCNKGYSAEEALKHYLPRFEIKKT